MLTRLFTWWVGDPTEQYTLNNRLAIIILTGIGISCFGLLSAQFAPVPELQDLELASYSVAVAQSNQLNQIFWLTLSTFAVFALLRDPARYRQLLLAQWPLLAMVLLAFVSTLWALDSAIAFRRAMLLMLIVLTVSVSLCFLRHPKQVLLLIYRVSTGALVLNLFTLTTGNFDLNQHFYGLYGQKNNLGAAALVALYFALACRYFFRGQINLLLNSVHLILWLLLLILSGSKTAIALLVLAPTLAYGLARLSRSVRLNIGAILLFGLCVGTLLLSLVLSWHDWDLKTWAAQYLSDPSLTGRDRIWAFLLEQIQQRWLLGHGYGSFWGIGPEAPNVVYGQSYLRLLNQGHNGYLDLLAILGITGLALYLFILIHFVRQSAQCHGTHPQYVFLLWVILLTTLIHNITESSLIRGNHMMWLLQLLVFFSTARLLMDAQPKEAGA